MYQPLRDALANFVKVGHACGLPFIAGQIHSVSNVVDEASIARLEERLLTVERLLRLRPLPKRQIARMGAAAQQLAEALKEARYHL